MLKKNLIAMNKKLKHYLEKLIASNDIIETLKKKYKFLW